MVHSFLHVFVCCVISSLITTLFDSRASKSLKQSDLETLLNIYNFTRQRHLYANNFRNIGLLMHFK